MAVEREITKKSIITLADQYHRCTILGIDYLVMHPGAHVGRGEDRGLKKIVSALDRVLGRIEDTRCGLLLETTAGHGESQAH